MKKYPKEINLNEIKRFVEAKPSEEELEYSPDPNQDYNIF